MHGSRLGPAFTDQEVRTALDQAGAKYTMLPDDDSLCERVAGLMSEENVSLAGSRTGWNSVRAHSARAASSVTRAARAAVDDEREDQVSRVVPAVRAGGAAGTRRRLFRHGPGTDSPYMLLVAPVRDDRRTGCQRRRGAGFDKLKVGSLGDSRGHHVDYSARVQTDRSRARRPFYQLVKTFERMTGVRSSSTRASTFAASRS
jgi:carbamoyltransferase